MYLGRLTDTLHVCFLIWLRTCPAVQLSVDIIECWTEQWLLFCATGYHQMFGHYKPNAVLRLLMVQRVVDITEKLPLFGSVTPRNLFTYLFWSVISWTTG